MTRKLFAAVVLSFLTVSALYAQKPVICAVTDIEDDPTNGLEMCRSLFTEYYLAELMTHSKVNVLDTKSVQTALGTLKLERGRKMTAKQFEQLCAQLKCGALCLVGMKREKDGKMLAEVRIVDKNGKTLGSVSALMNGVGDTDSVSARLARSSAVIIRKANGSLLSGDSDLGEEFIYKKLPNTVKSTYGKE